MRSLVVTLRVLIRRRRARHRIRNRLLLLFQVNSIEFASVQAKVFEALKRGNTTLQGPRGALITDPPPLCFPYLTISIFVTLVSFSAMNDEMKSEDVEKLMEDSQEAVEYQSVSLYCLIIPFLFLFLFLSFLLLSRVH